MAQEYAVKGNREIAITKESEKEQLIRQGYDIVNAKGELITPGRGKTVSYERYEAVVNENKKLKDENKKLKDENKELKDEIKKLKKE